MNLGRIGHYFTPSSGPAEELAGSCRTAIVVEVYEKVDGNSTSFTVNLASWQKDGDSEKHLQVPVGPPGPEQASFHLNADCPWKR